MHPLGYFYLSSSTPEPVLAFQTCWRVFFFLWVAPCCFLGLPGNGRARCPSSQAGCAGLLWSLAPYLLWRWRGQSIHLVSKANEAVLKAGKPCWWRPTSTDGRPQPQSRGQGSFTHTALETKLAWTYLLNFFSSSLPPLVFLLVKGQPQIILHSKMKQKKKKKMKQIRTQLRAVLPKSELSFPYRIDYLVELIFNSIVEH